MLRKVLVLLLVLPLLAFAVVAQADDCVEVDLEITPYAGPGDQVDFSFELTNCGTEAALVDLTFEFTFEFDNDTLVFPGNTDFSIPLQVSVGAGETINRAFMTVLPPVVPSGTYTVCAEAVIGEAVDSDCGVLVVEGVGGTSATIDFPDPLSPEAVVDGLNLVAAAQETECVEVDIEITSPVQPLDEIAFSFEVTNCGTEAGTVVLDLELTSSLINENVPVITVEFPLGAGETATRSFTAVLPPIVPAGSHEICVTATIGNATATDCTTLVVEEGGTLNKTSLGQNYPNPFNAATMINFSLNRPSEINLSVYNVLGEKVATAASGFYEAGPHTVNWDAENVSSGMYFYRLITNEGVQTKKMILTK